MARRPRTVPAALLPARLSAVPGSRTLTSGTMALPAETVGTAR